MWGPPHGWGWRAQPHGTHCAPVLWLVLAGLRCAVGERDGDSLAVDTGAHFHGSKHLGSSRRDARDLDVIESLGHEIAEQLAERQHDHHGADDTLSIESLLQEQRASHTLSGLEHSHGGSEVDDLASEHSSAAVDVLKKLEGLSNVLQTTSVLEKSGGTSARTSMEESEDVTPPAPAEKSVDVSQDASRPPVGREARELSPLSQRELAELFQPSSGLGKPASMLQSYAESIQRPETPKTMPEAPKHYQGSHDSAAVELLQLKESLARDVAKAKKLMGKESKLHYHQRRGLDGVAGTLLQLEETVKLEQMRRRGDLPSFEFLDKEHRGSLSLEEFKQSLSSVVSDPDVLFHKLDKNSKGTIDKAEYELGVKENLITVDDIKPELVAEAAKDGGMLTKSDSAANHRSRPCVSMLLISLLVFFCRLA